MRQFNGKKMVNIEIEQCDLSGVHGYCIWQDGKLLSTRFYDIDKLLNDKQQKSFFEGASKFRVPAETIFDALGVFV